MRNEFIRILVPFRTKNMKFFRLQKDLFSSPFLEFRFVFFGFFCWSFWNIVIKRYINFFLVIIIIFICRTLCLSIIIPFDILKFSSNKKLEKEKLNKKSSLFKKFLELHILLGFLWEKRVRKLSFQFRSMTIICRSLFSFHFCKN